jgi:hypothetical protein
LAVAGAFERAGCCAVAGAGESAAGTSAATVSSASNGALGRATTRATVRNVMAPISNWNEREFCLAREAAANCAPLCAAARVR